MFKPYLIFFENKILTKGSLLVTNYITKNYTKIFALQHEIKLLTFHLINILQYVSIYKVIHKLNYIKKYKEEKNRYYSCSFLELFIGYTSSKILRFHLVLFSDVLLF